MAQNSFGQIFEELFNNREIMPLVPSKLLLAKYDLFINNVNSKFLKIGQNPHLINHIDQKLLKYLNNLLKNNPQKYESYNIGFNNLEESYKYFVLNAVRFGKRPDNKSYKLLIKQLGLTEYTYSNNNNWGGYENIVISDIRLTYLFKNIEDSTYNIYRNLLKNKFYIENMYYINRLYDTTYIDKNTRVSLLKSMKENKSMDSSQVSKFNKFVCIDKFAKLASIISNIVGKYYITGSIIDYINNTNLKPNQYDQSDIDIVITDKTKYELLAGVIVGYLKYAQNESDEDINNIISYTGKYITLDLGYFSNREIQIYYMKEKYCVFAHHFPCVRGYITSSYKMSLSQQAIDIFRPDSDKKIKFVFMFPYTDVEKSRKIIKKYKRRGYTIE